MALFPRPVRMIDHADRSADDLGTLTSVSSALGNALVLLGHPFKIKLNPHSSRWSLSMLAGALAPPWRRRRRAACRSQLHHLANGSVQYEESAPYIQCSALLNALKTAPPVYGVVDLQSRGAPLSREACGSSTRDLSENVRMLTGLGDRIMAGQATFAHVNLRLGTAAASGYEMHYDSTDNLLMQLSGRKVLWLAPPSQLASAHMGELRPAHASLSTNSTSSVTSSGRMPAARHSPIDWRQPRDAIARRFPRAARLRALRVVMREGEALYLPARWLHHVVSNEAPPPNNKKQASLAPWVSLNAFFTHVMHPRFQLFDSCVADAVRRQVAAMPAAHVHAFGRLGVETARSAYCM